MLTGTPLDLTPFGGWLRALGWGYWLIAVAGIWWALRGERPWKAKLLRALPILLVFGIGPAFSAWSRFKANSTLDDAMALFQERCKSAGERIIRTVDNVDGIVWMRWREKTSNADNFADQWKLNDPYGQDCGAEDCIANLLRVSFGLTLNPERAKRHMAGYRIVETEDPKDHLRYRYTAGLKQYWQQQDIDRHKKTTGGEPPPYSYQFAIERSPIATFTARYGVTWEDISTRDDRAHWIAGGSLKVVDLLIGEVIAERVGYMIDRGQGSQAGFRSPWAFAVQTACPEFPHEPTDSRRGRTRKEVPSFVTKVLRPSVGA